MGEITEVSGDGVEARSVLLILNGFSKFTLRLYKGGKLDEIFASGEWDSIELTEGEDGS